MEEEHLSEFLKHFSNIKDYRDPVRVNYKLSEIFFLTLCAVLSGCDDFVEISNYGQENIKFLKKYLPYENGIPSHDTLNNVFNKLNPIEFNKCFIEWAKSIGGPLSEGQEIVAIDGKSVRGSHDRASGKRAIHMVSAWASERNISLGQIKVSDKSNEIKAIPELLELIDVKSKIVTIDAIGTQKKIAKKIIDQKADYVLSVKNNQKKLYNEIANFFTVHKKMNFEERGYKFNQYEQIEKGHGRIEIRKYVMLDQIGWMYESKGWDNIRSVGMVESTRIIGDKTTTQKRYYISSLKNDVDKFARAVRSHWGIENKVHWLLDVSMHEDQSRTRKENGPENLSAIRKTALNLLKLFPSKDSIKVKRKKLGWNQKYLKQALKYIIDL